MPNRYWVGGSGTWNSTNTANWASTSGGAGGAGVPTADDDVFFDGNSDTGAAFTVTVSGTVDCKTFNADTATPLDQAMTLSRAGTTIRISGSLYLPATNFSISGNGFVAFNATSGTHDIITNGITLNNGSGSTASNFGFGVVSTATWVLGSAFSANPNTALDSGTLNTNGYSAFFGTTNFIFRQTSQKTLILGSSSVSSGLGTSFTFSANATNTTIDAGTSTWTCTGASASLNLGLTSGGFTFYNVEFTSTALSLPSINGDNTFNNLTFASRAASGFGSCSLSDNQTITGTLSVQSGNTDPTRRILFSSNTPGTQRTITAAAIDFGSGIDFQDIVAAGAASPWDVSALSGGDCLNNTDITFPAAKTVYRIGTGNFSATQWAATSGGSPAADQFPLAQDTMVFDANTTTGTHTINANYQLGTLDMTDSTTVTLASGTTTPTFYGDITLSNAVTPSGTGTLIFGGRNTQTITSSGRTFTQNITINSLGGTIFVNDNLNCNLMLQIITGTLNFNDKIIEVRQFDIPENPGLNPINMNFGNGKLVVFGSGIPSSSTADFSISYIDTLTITGSAQVELTATSGTIYVRASVLGTPRLDNIVNIKKIGGSNSLEFNSVGTRATSGGSFQGIQRVKNLDFENYTGQLFNNDLQGLNIYGDLTLSTGMTVQPTTNILNFRATSETQQITTNGVTIASPILVDAPGATVQLQDNLTQGSTQTFTHTAGTVDLNGKTMSVGAYSSSNSNTRSLNFNGGKVQLSGNDATIWNTSTLTNATFAGNSLIEATYNGGVGTRTITQGSPSEANSLNFSVTAGTDTIAGATIVKDLKFTGFGGTLSDVARTIYGDLVMSPTMTSTGTSAFTMSKTSGTQFVTCAGAVIGRPVTKVNNGILQFSDSFSVATDKTLTLTAGGIIANDQDVTVGSFVSTGGSGRSVNMGSGLWSISGTGTVWNVTSSLVLLKGTGKISLTDGSSTARTFIGGGKDYNHLGIDGATGSSTTSIQDANAFNRISSTKTVAHTIEFPNVTTRIGVFEVNGSSGNLVTLQRTGGSGTFTIDALPGRGYNTQSFLSISNSDATPSNFWFAQVSTDGGDNTGWVFGSPTVGNFLQFFDY
jgi:hypothetical protein